jgi:hypothetical protein
LDADSGTEKVLEALMEPWGVNQKSTDEAVEPLSQADASCSSRPETVTAKRRRVSVALLIVGALVLSAGGGLHSWRKSASQDHLGNTQVAGKSQIGKLADSLLKGTSLFRSSSSKSSDKLEPNKATKMSGAPLSLPLFFEANRGQTDAHVKFLARSSGYTLFVTPTETVFAGARTAAPRGMLPTAEAATDSGQSQATLRMKLLQSNPGPEVSGAKELPGKVNYLIGNNPRDWHTGIPLYEEVRSREVYPGIDLVFHGDQQRLEYDFQVAPGADPGRIRFKVSGAEKIAVDENGDLLLKAVKTEFRMRKPVIYQQVGEQRRPVNGGFSLQGGKLVAFRVGAYDKSMPLVIDPTIIFASFLGAAGVEVPSGIDLDVTNPSAPKLFVAGSTSDITTFAETNTKLGSTSGAGDYAFVAKIDPKTTGAGSLDFLTFIGGSLVFTGGTAPCQNLATDMKVDISGGVGQTEPVLLGLTTCRDFPVTIGGPSSGTDDLFVARLTPAGAGIDSSTLFGGNGSEGLASNAGGASLYLNPEGTIVLSGETTSTDFATTTNAYSVSLNNGTPGGFDDCYVAKMDRSFNILYLTYLNVGGNSSAGSTASCGVGAIDPAGKIYVGGTIYSATAFSLNNGGTGANGFQKSFVGTPGTTPNTFVAVLDPSLGGVSQMTYSTYFAGGGGTNVQAGAVDVAHGIAAIGGTTISNSTTNAPDIPILNAIQATNNSPAGVGTGWVAVIDTTKTGVISLVASSYLGGSTGVGSSSVRSVAIDPVPGNPPTQRIVVGGQTTATNFPTMNPLQASLVGTQNGFVSVLSVPSSGATFNMSLLFSTYLGGALSGSGQGDSVRSVIADSNHAVYAVGRTASATFFGNTTPATTVNGFQQACASCGGGTPQADLAIFVLTPQSGTSVPDLTVTKSHSGNFAQGQSGAQYSITVTNSGTGTTVGAVSLVDSLPSSLTATGMTGTGWSCSISTLVCTRSDALAGGASYPVITLTVNVAGSAPPSVTNTVTVSGGSETNTANDTASDPTTISSSVGACTDNYIGPNTGAYGTATNWSTGAVPGISDVACIPSGFTVFLNTGLPVANQTISALNGGTLNFSAGPLTVTNNSVANSISITGGTLAFNGQLTVSGPFSVSAGTFGGTGEVDLNGAFTWSGGTMNGAGTTNARGGLSIPNATVILDVRTLNVTGTTTFGNATGGSFLYMSSGAAVNNQAGATWNIVNGNTNVGNGIIYNGGTLPAFNNAGTFEMTGGTSDNVGVPFNNTGSVMSNSETLNFSGGGNCGTICSGTYTAGAGGIIAFTSGTFVQGGPINGAGTVNFSGATMNFGSGIETISSATTNFSAGTITNTGSINFTTLLTWTGGSWTGTGTTNTQAGLSIPNNTVFLDTRTLNASGTTTFGNATGGSFLYMSSGAAVNNQLGATWNIVNGNSNVGNGIIYNGGALPAFNNAGTFEMTGGTSDTVSVPFNNIGSVMSNSETLNFSGGGNCGTICSGTYTAGAGGTIAFTSGTFVHKGPINGPGTVNFSGATMNFGSGTETISTANVNFSAGTITNTGSINFATLLTWTGGTWTGTGTTNTQAGLSIPNASVILDTRTLNVSGTTTFGNATGGSFLYLSSGAVVNNQLGATWNIVNGNSNSGNGIIYNGGALPAFNNTGTFEMTGGTSDTVSVPFNNTGSVMANGATLFFNSGGICGGTCAGAWSAGTGGALNFGGGTFALSGSITGAGTVIFSGGTENLTGTYNIPGGTTVSGGTANFTGTLTSAGALTISSGTANFSNSGGAVNTSTLTFSGGTLTGTSTLTVSGLLNWSGGTMNGTGVTNANGGMSIPNGFALLDTRMLNVSGTTTFGNAVGGSFLYLSSGAVVNNKAGATWNIVNGSSNSGNGIIYNGGALPAFNNTGTFEMTGGTSDTVSVPFNNTGTMAANAVTLSFTGAYSQTAGNTILNGGSIQTTSTNPLLIQGGSLTGTGTVQGDVTNTGGSVAPGSSVAAGALSFNGSGLGVYSQSATGAFNVKIGGTAGGQFDTLTTSGATTLGGPLNVSLINSFSPAVGNTFTILTAASVTGTFSSTNLPALTTGLGWQVTYNPTNVVLSVVTVSSPVANLNPGSVPFPNTIVNTAATIQKVQLQNTGTAALLITSIQPTGPDAANYSYTVDATQPCPISPATLGVGTSCMLDIGFLPLTAGTHNNAQITVTDNSGNVVGSTQTVALSGTGIALTSIAVTPAPVTIAQGNSIQFTATGTYSDSSTQNLTSTVTWASATISVATINAAGLAQGVAPGTSNITAKQGAVTSPAAVLTVTGATHFAFSNPGIAIAGTAFSVTVFAEDQFNSVVPGYTGTVHFTSTDGAAVLPANSTLTNGSGVFQVTLKTLGGQTITATDTVTPSITGTTSSITVGSGAATHFVVSAPGAATAGTAFNVSVTALDQFNNIAAGYTGTVHFTSTDGSATLPANTTLTSGTGLFPVTLKTSGSQTVTATDTVNGTITGTSGAIVVTAALQTITVAPLSATVSAGLTQPFTATGHFSDGTTGAVSVNWSSSDITIATINAAGVATGVKAGGPITITATSTTNAAITGTAQLTVTAATLQTITVAPPSATVSAGLTQPFTATGHFSDGTTGAVSVNWSSSDITIATINASGVATGVKAGGPITITATSGNIFGTAQLTVNPLAVTFPLNVTLIGTGTGSVTDNLGSINCLNTAGVISGTCSANYPAGTAVTLTATPTQPSTFGGWLQACTGTGGCSVTMNSAQSVTASFVPPPKMIPVPLTPGTNATGMATYDCPSNPNPSPGNPCPDPNAHATSLTIGQVLTPFTLTVVATEIPPTNGDGICTNGLTPTQDFDCRFKSFFTFQTKPNGDTIVPLCDPYANGNCVVYSVFFQNPGQEPDPSMYVGPINWNITYNNGTFVPPAPWTGSTPRLYYNPSGFVVPNSPYGTDCTTPMLIGNPGVPTNPAIFCQFVFDITTVFDASKKVDPLIGGKSKIFSDVVVAFPPIFAPVVTVTTTPDAATVTAGNPIGFTITVSNSVLATANNVSLNTPLPGGTNVNWTISPAFAGPGMCSITGAQGSQVLNCSFGTLNQSTSVSLHIQSASSAAGTAITPSTVTVGTQQLLSIGSIVVQPIPVTFSGLTASQTIPAGTSSVTLGGVIGNGTQFAPSGETVSISINGVKLSATVGSNGAFSLQFPTAGIPGSTTPYTITYSYAGDSLLSSATNSSTTLTVVSPPPGVNLSATLQSATIDGSGNYVFTVRITNSGGTTATAAAIKTAMLTTVVGTTRLTTTSTTTLPMNLGNLASLSSVTVTLTFPASAGPPNTAGAISLGLGFTGGSASSVVRATLP